MASAMKESQLIEKLNANNYATWQFKVKMLLIKEELVEVISRDPPIPANAEFTKKDSKARAIINLFIEDSQIIYVKNLETARATWETLKNLHERTNLSSKLYLLKKLYGSKLEETGDMQVHITKILETVDRLRAIGEIINESHISALYLCSLPPSYDTLITALEARPEAELTPEFIRSKLIDEFNRRKDNFEKPQNTAKAFQTNKKFPNNNNRKVNKYCTFCSRDNHYRSECWHLKRKTNDNTKNREFKNKFKNNSTQLVYERHLNSKSSQYRRDKYSEDLNSVESKMQNAALIANKIGNYKCWIIDSGSSSHITYDKTLFTKMNNTNKSEVIVANGNILTAYGSGEITFVNKTPLGKIHEITLKDVLYVPELKANLFSVRKATQNGCKINFYGNSCKLISNGNLILEGKINNNLYELKLSIENNETHANMVNTCNNRDCITLWHRRMGHKNFDSIKEIKVKQLANGINIHNCKHEINCEACIKSKLTDAPYPKVTLNKGNKLLQLIHSDVCGPMQVPTIGGKSYFLTFVDDYSRYTVIYLISKKSEVFSKLVEYIKYVSNKFGKIPENLRSDRGGEYIGTEIEEYLKNNGIHHQLSVPHCPSQNGIAERKNRTLVEMTRTLLSQSNLPKKFWGEAISTANYLQNRLPTKATNKTPYELWHSRKPNLKHLRVFGCKAYAYIHKSKRGKLDDKAEEGIFVGYENNAKAYRVYTGGKNITIARTVKFLENSVINGNNNSSGEILENVENETETVEIELENISVEEEEINKNIQTQPRRSDRSNRGVPPDRFTYLTSEINPDPKDWNDVMKIDNPLEKQNWVQATKEEINSLYKNKTWTLTDPPSDKRVIGCRWTFKSKINELGKIENYKARLVAKGYLQKYGEDYDETYAPVISYTTIRALLAKASYEKLNVNHVDIKTAFLHGELKETVYMKQPEGYEIKGKENKVCKLNKAIYGLKQAARAWHTKIAETLTKLKFTQSDTEQCLFKRTEHDNTIYIIVYVDDILIAGKQNDINKIVNQLKEEYEVKNLGEIRYYLGINVRKTEEGYYALNQKLKINDLVNKFKLNEAKPTNTPMEAGYKKTEDENNLLPNNHNYRSAIGSLLYLSNISRPDICAAVNILSRSVEKPQQKDWEQVKKVIRYLKTTKNLELIIKIDSYPKLTVYTDADWAGDLIDRKSTSGHLFLINESPILWNTKKQSSISLSSAEAEYISISTAIQDMQWIIKVLYDLDMEQRLPITIFEDNQSVIKMIESYKTTNKSKHIDVKYHHIRDLKENGVINLDYCQSKNMIADIFTKPLPRIDFIRNRGKLSLM